MTEVATAPLDVAAQLADLAQLEDGWFDGEGCAPDRESLAWLADRFERCWPRDLPLPYLFPTVEGGVQAEWSLPPYEISLEVDLGMGTGEWHALNLETDAADTRTCGLGSDAEWAWLAGRVAHESARMGTSQP